MGNCACTPCDSLFGNEATEQNFDPGMPKEKEIQPPTPAGDSDKMNEMALKVQAFYRGEMTRKAIAAQYGFRAQVSSQRYNEQQIEAREIVEQI